MTPDDRALKRFAANTCRRQVLRSAFRIGRYRATANPGPQLLLKLKEISLLVPERWRKVWLKAAKRAAQ